ncbi:hypothetical protein ACFPJ1_04535 [Kribbella qitaiheensis]|uniref:hypothetical protein n=1 Tax=Kribbella qitaiheensis TaxID=1544730 RepID=UPI00361DF9F8
MDLLARAEALQAEGLHVLEDLDLETAFPTFGPPQLVGSVLSGLITYRDLDVTFTAPAATASEVLHGLATIATRPGLLTADFRDERADRRPTPAITDERFYAVLTHHTWKIDLTFWLHDIPRPHVAEATSLRAAPTDQKQAILHLKHTHPDYPHKLTGTDIYTAVLNHGVCTVDDLTEYLASGPL